MTDPAATPPTTEIEILPSILAADFTRLGEQTQEVIAAGAKVIHLDVMDGHFVPPITFGAQVVADLRERLSDEIYLDVHLMIEQPDRHVGDFLKAGADGITFHHEATPHVHRVLQQIREGGANAGLAICPGTPVEAFGAVADLLDLALVMTVNPGWGGQQLIPSTVDKTRVTASEAARERIVAVDGGVDLGTVGDVARAGARWLVAGSAVFGKPDPGEAFRALTDAARAAA